jgi:hypothetical protein
VNELGLCQVSAVVMNGNDPPSGPWTGFYTYNLFPGKYRTDVILSFADGRMTGEGNDAVGPFIISGRYDSASKNCYWTKTYIHQHDVAYTGFGEGKGIWGTWDIQNVHRGGFHIWPVGQDGEAEAIEHEEETPQEAAVVLSSATR